MTRRTLLTVAAVVVAASPFLAWSIRTVYAPGESWSANANGFAGTEPWQAVMLVAVGLALLVVARAGAPRLVAILAIVAGAVVMVMLWRSSALSLGGEDVRLALAGPALAVAGLAMTVALALSGTGERKQLLRTVSG